MSEKLRVRSENDSIRTRKFSIGGGKKDGTPSSLNEQERSIEIIVATETDKVTRYDWDFDRSIPEILVMSGLQLPECKATRNLRKFSKISKKIVFLFLIHMHQLYNNKVKQIID